MQDTKQFSSHESVQVSPVLSLYCIIHRTPPWGKRWEVVWRARIYLFIFISCPSSKLKANRREADFHLHTLQPSNCVTRPFSNTTLAAVQSQRRSKEIWFHLRLVPSKRDQAKVIQVYRHTPLRWSREPTLRIPQVTFQSIKEDFTALMLWRLSLALSQLVGRVWEQSLFKVQPVPSADFCTRAARHGCSRELLPAESHFHC